MNKNKKNMKGKQISYMWNSFLCHEIIFNKIIKIYRNDEEI